MIDEGEGPDWVTLQGGRVVVAAMFPLPVYPVPNERFHPQAPSQTRAFGPIVSPISNAMALSMAYAPAECKGGGGVCCELIGNSHPANCARTTWLTGIWAGNRVIH